MRELKLKALAKINLGLDVLGKREDGYHELKMIMQTIKLYDQVQLTVTAAKGVRMKTNLSFLPADENNLAYKAADLMLKEFSIPQGVFVQLTKHIPVAAGLAGGSSDAAAVLVGINRLFELGLSKKELMERGVKLGADVPYCILRGTALAEGIGERLTVLPAPPACQVLLAIPKMHVSTKYVYENLNVQEIKVHPDIEGQIEALCAKDLTGLSKRMGNVLETVTVPVCPAVKELKETMLQMGALNALMSGSGPTVFGLFEDPEKARRAYGKLQGGSGTKQVFLTEFYNPPLREAARLRQSAAQETERGSRHD